MSDNLPPGVTASDIDRHFSSPDLRYVRTEVGLVVEIGVPSGYTQDEIESAVIERIKAGTFDVVDIEVKDEC